MPTYEYICKNCGHLFEIVQSMRDDPLTECPQCGGELRKVFTAPAIAFKGSGFYATDQRKKSSRSGDSQEKKGSSTSSDSASGSKTEKKSETETKTEKTSDKKGTETKTGGSDKGSGSGSSSGSSD
jgi:putative FmdB family regulatory protein